MASCSYSSIVKEKSSFPCGSNWKNPEDFSCVTLRDCNLNIASHLTSCKVADNRIENKFNYCLLGQVLFFFLLSYFLTFRYTFEFCTLLTMLFDLLCVGVFIIEEFHTLLTVCPQHREKYGVGWRTGKVRCSIPSEIAGHYSPTPLYS